MACNLDSQEKARQEIYRVVGTGRLPEYGDRPALPYVDALYREVMRWYPVSPLGVPHATTQDDIYEGYFIPKGDLFRPCFSLFVSHE